MDLQPASSDDVGTGINHLEGEVVFHTSVICDHLNDISHVVFPYHFLFIVAAKRILSQ